jgi:hypothetical protein
MPIPSAGEPDAPPRRLHSTLAFRITIIVGAPGTTIRPHLRGWEGTEESARRGWGQLAPTNSPTNHTNSSGHRRHANNRLHV